MRIVVADDEYLVRASLISMIQEFGDSYEICGQVESGEELLEKLTEFRPDLVLLDLRMPEIGGMETMRVGKKQYPHVEWMVLTGFSDFESARESVRLGAADYLLKPVSSKELGQALSGAKERIEERRSLLQKQIENNMQAAISGLWEPSLEEEDSFLNRAQYMGVTFAIDSCLDGHKLSQFSKQYFSNLREELCSYVSDLFYPMLLLHQGEMVLVCAWLPDAEETGIRSARRLLRNLEDALPDLNDRTAITLFTTSICESVSELRNDLQVTAEFHPYRVIKGMNRSWSQEQLSVFQTESLLQFGQLWIDLSEAYIGKNYFAYIKILERLQQCCNEEEYSEIFQNLSKSITAFVQLAMDCKIEFNGDAWATGLYSHGETLLRRSTSKDSSKRIIDQVIQHLERNYASDLTLSEVASHYQVSPNYLSTLFHQTTGITFVKYLTRLRMMRAKQLLADQGLQVQQVVEKVGYYSARHFSKCFFEFEGCSPSEYKKKAKRKMEGIR